MTILRSFTSSENQRQAGPSERFRSNASFLLLIVCCGVCLQGAVPPWLKQQQEQLARDQQAYAKDNTDFGNASSAALQQATDRVVNSVVDKLGAALTVSDPIMSAQILIEQNLPTFQKALNGNWSDFAANLRDGFVKALELGAPDWFDSTYVQQAFDMATLQQLKVQSQALDQRADDLLVRGAVLQRFQEQAINQNQNLPDQNPPDSSTGVSVASNTASTQNPAAGATLDDAVLLDRWLNLGNRAFDNQQQADGFFQQHPSLTKYRDVADDHAPISEIEQDYQDAYADSLTSAPASATEFTNLLGKARSKNQNLDTEVGTLRNQLRDQNQQMTDLDKELTKAQVQSAQTVSGNGAITSPSLQPQIPPGWVPCTCPSDHPNAGLFVNGVQYHTPLLHCPQ